MDREKRDFADHGEYDFAGEDFETEHDRDHDLAPPTSKPVEIDTEKHLYPYCIV